MEIQVHFASEFERLIEDREFWKLKDLLEQLQPADIVDILRNLDLEDQIIIFRLLYKETAAEVFAHLESEEQEQLLQVFTEKKLREILEEMEPDNRTELLDELPAGVVKRLLQFLSPEERQVANWLLNYPEDSAGRLMTPEFVDLKAEMTVEEAIQHIRATGQNKETIYYCYVIGKTRELLGIVSLRDLILAKPDKRVMEIMEEDVIKVHTTDDQETVARVIEKYDLLAVPVVDKENRLVGIITVDDIMDIVQEETTEDFQKMAAIQATDEAYFHTPILTFASKRILWLIVLLLSQLISVHVIKGYSQTLESLVALAFFIPMLIGTGGNVGTQSATLIIRGLATGEIALRQAFRVLGREGLIGLILGGALGVIAFIRVYLTEHDLLLQVAVSVALVFTVITANITGALLPLLFRRLNIDPAIIASPFITTVVDITGLIIYFEVARWFLGYSFQ